MRWTFLFLVRLSRPAPVQPRLETNTPVYDEYHYNHRHSAGSGIERDDDECHAAGGHRQPAYRNQLEPSSYAAPSTASEPGDYYDYGWDYETAASSGHQTPQTPMSYRYQQQQQQLERWIRPDGRPVRHYRSYVRDTATADDLAPTQIEAALRVVFE